MPKTPQRADLPGYLNALVEELRRLIPQALRSSKVDAVHDARVTTRRLKAALELLEPVLSEKTRREFASTLKRLRRALGPLRDANVMAEHLERYRRAPVGAAAAWMARRLKDRRGKLRRAAAREASVPQVLKGLGTWWAIEEELREAEEVQAPLVHRTLPRQLDSFVKRTDALVRIRKQNHAQAQQDVHALRIDGKVLRYTLELAMPIGFDLPPTLFDTFRQLQDALGLWHDYVVLGEQCLRSALKKDLALHDPTLYGQVLDLAQRCRRDSEKQLDRFARLWSKSGQSIKAQIQAVLKPVRFSTGLLRSAGSGCISPAAAPTSH